MDDQPSKPNGNKRYNPGAFKKGERRPNQGGYKGGGRPKFHEEVKRKATEQAYFLAAEMAIGYFQNYLGAAACVFIEAATGIRPPGSPLKGKPRLPVSLSHNAKFIEIFVAPAARKFDGSGLGQTVEDFFQDVMAGKYKRDAKGEPEEAQVVNPNQIEDKSEGQK